MMSVKQITSPKLLTKTYTGQVCWVSDFLLWLNFYVFGVITGREVVWHRRFGTICRSNLEGSSCPRNFHLDILTLKMGPTESPETSVLNPLTSRNNPEGGRIQFNGGGNRRPRIVLWHILVPTILRWHPRFLELCSCAVTWTYVTERTFKITQEIIQFCFFLFAVQVILFLKIQ